MKRWGFLFLLSVLPVLSASAQENVAEATPVPDSETEMRAEIDRLRKIILEEQQIIAATMKRIDALEATKTAQDKAGINNVKFNGDFRYRFEYIKQDPQSNTLLGVRGPLAPPRETDSRERHRLRLRLGADYAVNDEVTVGARIATTMNADNISTNQTLDDAFAKKDLWLDTAYFEYRPNALPGAKAVGGKMINPFYAPGKTQMIWDQDITPEGLAVSYTNTMIYDEPLMKQIFRAVPWELGGTAAYFLVDERAIDVEAYMLGIQGTAKRNFAEDGSHSLMLGASYYNFSNVEGFPPLFAANDNFGNALSSAILGGVALYENDFDILEAFGEYTVPLANRPFSLYADVAVNTAPIGKDFDDENDRLAWAVGASYGRCVAPRSWGLRYEYRHLDRDAVIGAFTDSDFGGGGTNARGHIFGAEFMLLKNTRIALTYIHNDNIGSDALRLLPTFGGRENVDGPYQRLQVDLNFKF